MGYMDLMMSYTNKMRIVEAPASGGGLSQNGKFSYGYASSAGKRPSMEDFFETRVDGIDGEIVGLFGVFDGHGGARAAEYVKRHLFRNLITHPKFISDTKSAIADAYTHTDSELLKSENSHTRDAGSTASTAILVGDRLLVANVGDSRAVICRGGNAFAVSRDHKPDQSDERERIENAGGFVMWAGTWRVGGILAVSRAFGDRLLKQYVVADPEIQEEKIDDSLEFLILASDGLWDVFSNEEAVAVVKEVGDPEESTKKLVGEAIQRGSADNITCVVVRFLESKTGNYDTCSSSKEANQEKIAVRNDSDGKSSAKETNQDLTAVNTGSEVETLNQNPIAVRSADSSTQKSVAVTAAGGRRNNVSSEQSGSAKEIKQELTAVNTNTEDENLNQKPIAARSDDSSTQKPVAVTAAGGRHSSVSSDQSGSAKQTNQDLTAVYTNTKDKTLNQTPIAARSDNSSENSSTQKPVAVTAAGGRRSSVSSEQSGEAKETNQNRTTVHTDSKDATLNQKPISARNDDSSTQKPVAVTAGGGRRGNVSSEQSGSVKETNQNLAAIYTDNKDKALNQKPIAGRSGDSLTQTPIAVTEAGGQRSNVSSEKSGSAGEMPIAIPSGSEAKSSAKVPSQEKITSDNDLDHSISKQKPVAATHTTSSEQRGSLGEKNQKPNTVHSDTVTSKASSVLSTSNKNAH